MSSAAATVLPLGSLDSTLFDADTKSHRRGIIVHKEELRTPDTTRAARPAFISRVRKRGSGECFSQVWSVPTMAARHERCTARVYKYVAGVATFGDPNCVDQTRRSSGSAIRFTETVGNSSKRGAMPMLQLLLLTMCGREGTHRWVWCPQDETARGRNRESSGFGPKLERSTGHDPCIAA